MNSFPNTRIGILGGGQLGCMLLQAALDWTLDVAVMDGDASAPARRFTRQFTHASITDYEAVMAFGRRCDVLTTEIENVNVQALEALQKEGVKVYPQPDVVATIGNKLTQKRFYEKHGIPTSAFMEIPEGAAIQEFASFLPAFQKLNTGGYDGKGVKEIKSTEDLVNAMPGPAFLEKAVDVQMEVAVVVARTERGEMKAFAPVESVYVPGANLVDYLYWPGRLTMAQSLEAERLACRVAQAFGIVGLLAVEMFLTREGTWLVNECAPRPHNTGHSTIEAGLTSQYEQHWRAILGLPLGDPAAHTPSAMVNLIGAPGHAGPAYYKGLEECLAQPGTYVHLYGKAETRPNRKMGHVTIVDKDPDRLNQKINFVKQTLSVTTHP